MIVRRPGRARKLIRAPVETALEAIGTLEPGCSILGMTKGQFSLIDLIKACLKSTGPAHLLLSTWTVGIRDAENVAFLHTRGDLLSLRLLVDQSFVARKPEYCAVVRATFGQQSIRCASSHAKFALLGNDQWKLAIRSSMNLNRNPRFEQFDIDDDPILYAFLDAFMAEIEASMPEGFDVTNRQVQTTFEAALGGGVASEAYRAEKDEGGWTWANAKSFAD